MARIAIIGASGQLGSDLVKALAPHELIKLNHTNIEVSDIASVKKALKNHKPEIVINTAAFHRTDDCETDPDRAYRINAIGARNVAVITEEIKAKLVFMSTDYVFGGEGRTGDTPYTEFDTPIPLSVYGRSKLAGEKLVQSLSSRYFIVRASGLFGVAGASGKGGNFVETMLRLGKERSELRVVSDQVFSPTYTLDLAKKIGEIIDTECYGIFHITNRGSCSWYDFTCEILRLTGLKTPVIPITSAEFPQKAKRPSYSVLDNYQLRLLKMDDLRTWQEALESYLLEKGHLKLSA